jgi:hypothetical protein
MKTKQKMKKIILVLIIISTRTSLSAQTLKSYYNVSNNIVVNYIDNLNEEKSFSFIPDTLNSGDSILYKNYLDLLQKKINEQPKSYASVEYVAYKNDAFTITGDYFMPVLKLYSELSTQRKAIVDALKTKIHQVKGVNMTTLYTRFGSNLVTINGVEYPYEDFISVEFSNAIQLSIMLYNGL